jgi:hypothetical protein
LKIVNIVDPVEHKEDYQMYEIIINNQYQKLSFENNTSVEGAAIIDTYILSDKLAYPSIIS